MAIITRQYNALDGWDVEVTLQNGSRQVFHFANGLPENVQAEVDALEARLLLARQPRESEIEVETEDGTIV